MVQFVGHQNPPFVTVPAKSTWEQGDTQLLSLPCNDSRASHRHVSVKVVIYSAADSCALVSSRIFRGSSKFSKPAVSQRNYFSFPWRMCLFSALFVVSLIHFQLRYGHAIDG